jgi:hypothetical protein
MAMAILRDLWADESGVIISAELVIVLTVVVLALVVGLTALRDALVTELGDISGAIGSLNQSYSYGGIVGPCAATAGSAWVDLRDDDVDNDLNNGVANSGGIVVCTVVAAPEGVQGEPVEAAPASAPQGGALEEQETETDPEPSSRLVAGATLVSNEVGR